MWTVTRAWRGLTAGVLVLAALAGCSSVPGSGSVPDRARAAPLARVTAWAVTGGVLSVLVRNPGPRTIASARAVITARDRHGNAVATVSGPATAACCAVADVPAGRSYGLATDLGAAAVRVRSVSVRYVDLVTASPVSDAAAVEVGEVALQTDTASTVVRASLMPGVSGLVRTQAVLTGAAGRLVAVVAGPARCLTAGARQQVVLAFDHRVPAGTVVGSIEVFALAPTAATPCPAGG